MTSIHFFLPVRVQRSGVFLHLGYYEVSVRDFWLAVSAITEGGERPCVDIWWTYGCKSYYLNSIEYDSAFIFRSFL